ncbi:vacuolar protein sorting-associated protein 29 [Monosporozyma servazzii]
MLLVALGDAYIPDRAIDIPLKFKKLLSIPDKISHIALLGNSTQSSEFLTFLNQISPNISIVRGEFDNPKVSIPKHLPTKSSNNEVLNSNDRKKKHSTNNESKEELPLTSIIKVGDFRIGCCSGYTIVPKNDPVSLLVLARQLNVDILLWSGTHNVEAYTLEGKFFVNPGSCTGAFNSDWPIMNEPPIPQNRSESSIAAGNNTGGIKASNQDNSAETVTTMNPEDSQAEEEEEVNEEDIEIPTSIISGSNTPSFCLLDIQNSTCTLYIYIYVDGEVRVDKVVYKKTEESEESQQY